VIVNLDEQNIFFLGYVVPIEDVDGACIHFGGRQIVDYGFSVEISGNIDRPSGRMDTTLVMSDPTQPAANGHLIGAQLHLIGDGQSECSGSFQINNEFKFRWLLNRQIARLLTFENSSRVKASQTISFRKI